MKTFRILVVLMLAVLLPMRGALAATMLCATAGESSAVTVALHVHGPHAEHADHSEHAMHGHQVDALVADASASHHDGASGHAGTCHLCAGCCCTTPLAMAPPEVFEPVLTSKVVFPALSAPAPAFHSEGQERPPRSI